MRAVSITVCLLAGALAFVTAPLRAQQRDLALEVDPARRVALVVGNNDYQYAPKLRNAANDARDLSAALRDVGFEVETLIDADLRSIDEGINRLISRLRPGDVAMFHYSGHGIQVGGENFLIPVNFELRDEASVRYDAYSVSKLHDRLAGAGSKLNIVTLDACRNNGFQASRSTSGGLALMNAAEGSFIAFATGPGMTADDNRDGRNGLFTSKLLDALREPGLSIDAVFNRVRQGVYEDSAKQQLPWSSSSVIGDFYFRRPEKTTQPEAVAAGAASAVPADAAWRLELAFWEGVRDRSNPALFESYLAKYPNGNFADLARIQLEELRSKQAAPATKPEPQPEPTAAARLDPPAPKQPTLKQPTQSQPTRAQPAQAQASPPQAASQPAPAVDLNALPVKRGGLSVPTRVARNLDELQAMAATEDRTYTAFALPLSSKPQPLGSAGWQVMLTGVDAGKQRFTLWLVEPPVRRGAGPGMKPPTLRADVAAAEKNTPPMGLEFKNAEALDPIQFNRKGPNACDEIVVLRVEQSRVVGYLAEGK
ncbi:MAG: hypothetical protein GC160_10330 [Acidobacteria bacterium]|nr:hypothetical protein [Acidobacteriota bacterium]